MLTSWLLKYDDRVTPLETRYIDASKSQHAQEEKRAEDARARELAEVKALANAQSQAKRRAWAIVGVLSLGLTGVIWFGLLAIRERNNATSRELAASAALLHADDPELSLQLAFEGLKNSKTQEAERSYRTALVEYRNSHLRTVRSRLRLASGRDDPRTPA